MSGYNVTPPQARPVRSRPLASPSSAAPLNRAASSSARPYYDAVVSDLCTLETFQTNFNTNEFVAQLTSKLVQRSKADPGPFNPRPFIRTFESALEQLVQIRSQVDAQSQQLSSSVHVAESAYTKKLDELGKNFAAVGNSFNSLEDRISEVGRTAIRIGEQLETIDKQRNRASEAHDLIEFYYMFARGDTSKLERLRKEGGREGRMKTAVIARRLAAISREVDVVGSEQTRDAIDRYCERFERDMLKLFDKFYRRSDPKMMSHIAKVLQGFNGGASCVQIYVNQHDFFISKDRVGEANSIELSDIWTHMADPDRAPPQSEPSLSALFNEIRQTVEIEAQIISAVFPNPLVVMQTFLQRVFAQSVQAFVEVIMDKAMQIHAPRFVGAGGTIDAKTSAIEPNAVQPGSGPTTSHLAFLRALHMARSGALSLVNDLKLYDYRGAGIIAPSSAANGTNGAGGHVGADTAMSDSMTLLGSVAVAAAGQLAGAAASPLAAMLDQSVEELFVPYMEGIRYIDRESRSLADLYAGLLAKFISLHRAAATAKKDKGFAGAGSTIFNRMRNQISANPDAASSSSSFGSASTAATANTAATSTASTSKTSFFKLSNLADRVRGTHTAGAAAGAAATTGQSGATAMSSEPSQDGSMTASRASLEDEVEDVDGELSLDVAEKMLRWHAESIGRCVDLSSASEVPKATFALLRVLTSAYIKTYIETALDSALAAVSAQDIRGATLPDVSSALSVVRSVEQVVSLWQHYVNTALVPLASTSVTLRREMVIFNNHNLLRVEGKCDALMHRVADNVVGFLANRLATQKKNDFVPKNDDLAFARQNTEPCVACSEALEKVEHAARMHLSPSLRLTSSTSGALRGSPGMASRPATSSRTRGVGSTDSGEAKRVSWSGVDEEEEDELQHSYLSRNAETLLTEIGVAFHGLLLDHLRKYTVSAAGGIMLTKDLALYQEAIGTFGISVVSDRFEMLRQLGNLFIVQASVLKSYMREGHLAKIDERLLRPYLLRRADYAREVRDLDDGPAPSTPTSASPDLFAQSAQGRDLFSHIPALISQNQPAAREGTAKTPEEQRLHRLAEVLAQLENHTLAASKPQQPSADPAASTSK